MMMSNGMVAVIISNKPVRLRSLNSTQAPAKLKDNDWKRHVEDDTGKNPNRIVVDEAEV